MSVSAVVERANGAQCALKSALLVRILRKSQSFFRRPLNTIENYCF
eukprot:COSAG01_NODE_2174_length_8226_cov_8.763961_9_plen_45_part_01